MDRKERSSDLQTSPRLERPSTTRTNKDVERFVYSFMKIANRQITYFRTYFNLGFGNESSRSEVFVETSHLLLKEVSYRYKNKVDPNNQILFFKIIIGGKL